MNRLTSTAQTHITVGGRDYPLNTSYRNVLMTISAWNAHEDGELHDDPGMSALAFADIAIGNMLTEEPPFDDWQEAVRLICEYINRYSRNGETDDHRPPVLDLEQDASYIFDAFQLMGVDLDAEDISYPRFMSILRVIPKESPICRIVYLRQQLRAGKLTTEERNEIARVWGWSVILLRDRNAEKIRQENEDFFLQIQRQERAKRGMPPV